MAVGRKNSGERPDGKGRGHKVGGSFASNPPPDLWVAAGRATEVLQGPQFIAEDRFRDVTKMVETGKGARARQDVNVFCLFGKRGSIGCADDADYCSARS